MWKIYTKTRIFYCGSLILHIFVGETLIRKHGMCLKAGGGGVGVPIYICSSPPPKIYLFDVFLWFARAQEAFRFITPKGACIEFVECFGIFPQCFSISKERQEEVDLWGGVWPYIYICVCLYVYILAIYTHMQIYIYIHIRFRLKSRLLLLCVCMGQSAAH